MKYRVAICAVLLLAWFLAFAAMGVTAWFNYDDLMNLYAAADKPLSTLVANNFKIWSGVERPFAGLVNHLLWTAFGFHPLPFRIFCLLLLFADVALGAALMWRLSGSGAVALLGVVLFTYHANLTDLYLSSGTIYDLLCFSFYACAALWYLMLRQRGHAPTWLQTAGLCLLFILSMSSKEMAISLPVMLAVTEWLYGDRHHWRTTLACGALCAFMLFRIMSASALQTNPAYRPVYTAAVFWERTLHYTRLLLYKNDSFTLTQVRLFLAACAAVPLLLRRREAWWAIALAFVAPLPMLFVPARSFYVLFIPYLGFCLLAGTLLHRLVRVAWPQGDWGPALAALTLALWLAPYHRYMIKWSYSWYDTIVVELKRPGKALLKGLPPLPRGSAVLFLEDPYPPPPDDSTTLLYFVRMMTDDHTIEVERVKGNPNPPTEDQWGRYAAVLRLTKDRLIRVR